MNDLYRGFRVYKRLTDEVVVYRCFERLRDHRFFVQSADRVRQSGLGELVQQHEKRFWELLVEAAPEERGDPHETIEAAVAAFDLDFAVEGKG